MKLLFVVHRYAPFPGGSEVYVQNMAEEAASRGHMVAVLAGEHQGDYNGIHVTSNPAILLGAWDLIFVHGGDVNVQNYVLNNIKNIPSPVLYLLVLPSESQICLKGLTTSALIGYSTHEDYQHCLKYQVEKKSVHIRHGIVPSSSNGKVGFKEKYGITKKMFLTCGGYWPNKAIKELCDVFQKATLDDSILVTTGYDNRYGIMPSQSDYILPLLLDDRQEVLNAMKEAECLLMHSTSEGFGLVLLESMLNDTPWISRNIAGAKLMKDYGQTYETDDELLNLLKNFDRSKFDTQLNKAYVLSNHTVKNTVDDIENACIHFHKNLK
jgi:glycosyltransferase involved in cell wall biosynthesis